jgi:methylglutamate dehydrogenase subunit B
MQQFNCPFCGERPETEFAYIRSAESIPLQIPASVSQELVRLYYRTNSRGRSRELWQHASGCRSWLEIERDTVTHAVLEIVTARAQARPT